MKISDNLKFSSKHVQIDRSYAKMVIAISLASAVLIFSLVASYSLINKIKYQNKVIGLRSKAIDQLEANKKAVNPLVLSYQAFDSSTESAMGNSDKNSKIVLDALPSKYDFPALATSLEYLIQQSGNTIKGITGTDNELAAEQTSSDPKPVEIPIDVSAQGNYSSTKNVITSFERSIRPFVIKSLDFSGSDNTLTISVKASTYYQPEKKLEIKETTVTNGKTTAKKTTTAKTGANK